jgi:hypothetical protein
MKIIVDMVRVEIKSIFLNLEGLIFSISKLEKGMFHKTISLLSNLEGNSPIDRTNSNWTIAAASWNLDLINNFDAVGSSHIYYEISVWH